MLCELPFRNTDCDGPVLPFEYATKKQCHACVKHSNIFIMLGKLVKLGVASKELNKMTIEQMEERLKQLEKDGEKILPDGRVQETQTKMVSETEGDGV